MAKKLNKSEAIRDYAKANPGAGLTEVSKALEAKGIKVSPAHVAQALRSAGLYKSKKKAGRPRLVNAREALGVSPKAKQVNDSVVGTVNAAKDLIKACGGVENAIQLLKAVS